MANKTDTLKLCVIANVVNFKRESRSLAIPVTLDNRSKTGYLFYAFEKASILDTSMDSLFFNDIITNGGAGTVAIILDKTGKRHEVFLNILSDDDELKSDHENLDLTSIERLGKAPYVNGALWLKSMERKVINLRISMEKITLERGEYKLKLLYYAGKELHDVLGRSQIQKKEESTNSATFFGSIESNTIRLVVE